MSLTGLTRPRPKKWCHRRLTAAAAKRSLLGAVSQATNAGRNGFSGSSSGARAVQETRPSTILRLAGNLDRGVRARHRLLVAARDDFPGFEDPLLAELLREADAAEERGGFPEFGLLPLRKRMIVALGAAQVDPQEQAPPRCRPRGRHGRSPPSCWRGTCRNRARDSVRSPPRQAASR